MITSRNCCVVVDLGGTAMLDEAWSAQAERLCPAGGSDHVRMLIRSGRCQRCGAYTDEEAMRLGKCELWRVNLNPAVMEA